MTPPSPCNGNVDAALAISSLMMNDTTTNLDDLDDLSRRLRQEALVAIQEEPELTMLLHNTVLAPGVRTFEDAVATTITYRLLLRPCSNGTAPKEQAQNNANNNNNNNGPTMMFCPNSLRGIVADAFESSTVLEKGHTMSEAVRLDALAVVERDPAVDTLLEVVLFLKGFAALVCHRAAHYKWHTTTRKSMTALWLQSQASAVFGLDIHPAACMGAGILLDHGTGIVIGETAHVGDGCTLLHGVTLGGTGKDSGDRHPKVGRDVLIGANASLLGNISVGDGAKIGAGSIVLGPIPSGATAVGAPAKIIGRAKEAKPASTMDETLQQVSMLHKSESSSTVATSTTATTSATSRDSQTNTKDNNAMMMEDGSDNDWGQHGGGDGGNTSDNESNNSGDMPSTDDNDATVEDDAKDDQKEGSPDPGKPAKCNVLQAIKSKIKKRSSTSGRTNCCCPFRDYVRMAKTAPQGSITICALRQLLNPAGCSISEVGEVLFAMDTHNVGYVKPAIFFTDETCRMIASKTKLPVQQIEIMMNDFEAQWEARQQHYHQQQQQQSTETSSYGVVVEC